MTLNKTEIVDMKSAFMICQGSIFSSGAIKRDKKFSVDWVLWSFNLLNYINDYRIYFREGSMIYAGLYLLLLQRVGGLFDDMKLTLLFSYAYDVICVYC